MDAIPLQERPRERCLGNGPSCLSLRECLALILGSGPKGEGCLGLASAILGRAGFDPGQQEEERAFFTAMELSPFGHLQEIRGLGGAYRARLLAAFELGRRYSSFREGNRPRRTGGRARARRSLGDGDAGFALSRIGPEFRGALKEWLGFIPFYRDGNVGSFCLVERGSRTHVNTDPVELFARVLALRPAGFFLAHNHPSGNPHPSAQDEELTARVARMSADFGIRLIGHWIVTERGETWLEPPFGVL